MFVSQTQVTIPAPPFSCYSVAKTTKKSVEKYCRSDRNQILKMLIEKE